VNTRLRPALLGAVVVALLLPSCGSDTDEPTPSASPETSPSAGAGWDEGTVPTPEQLASVLVAPEDLEGDWTVKMPEVEGTEAPGVVPEEQRGNLPRIRFCKEAPPGAKAVAQRLEWEAFMQLGMVSPDPRNSQVFTQEFLLAAEPAEVESMFAALQEGMEACAGRKTEYPDGETGRTEELPVPTLGEAAYGSREVVEEASPRGPAIWDLRYVLVRDGAVLMSVQVGDVYVGEDAEPRLTDDDVDAILTAVAQKLP
jgi:hypothetical protein